MRRWWGQRPVSADPDRESVQELLDRLENARRDAEVGLTLAAGAVEAGEIRLAVELLDQRLASLAAFERSLAHGGETLVTGTAADAAAAVGHGRRRLAPTAPLLAAAAAVVALLAGTGANPGHSSVSVAQIRQLQTDYDQLSQALAAGASAPEVVQATERLHAVLKRIGTDDVRSTRTTRQLLERERSLLLTTGTPSATVALQRNKAALNRLQVQPDGTPPADPTLAGPPPVLRPLPAVSPAETAPAAPAAPAGHPVAKPAPTPPADTSGGDTSSAGASGSDTSGTGKPAPETVPTPSATPARDESPSPTGSPSPSTDPAPTATPTPTASPTAEPTPSVVPHGEEPSGGAATASPQPSPAPSTGG